MKSEKNIKNVAFTGMLFSLALVLSFFESILAGMMALPPGIRLGLANTVVIFALLIMGAKSALTLVVLKAVFGLVSRGVVAGALSLCGGLLSLAVMLALSSSRRVSVSTRMLSVFGAVGHNVGQAAAAMLLLGHAALVYYLPVLLFFGIITGLITGTIYKSMAPLLKRFAVKIDKKA